MECLSNGNWSDSSDIFCDPVSCGEIPEVNNSTYTNTGNVYGDSVSQIHYLSFDSLKSENFKEA